MTKDAGFQGLFIGECESTVPTSAVSSAQLSSAVAVSSAYITPVVTTETQSTTVLRIADLFICTQGNTV